MNEKTLVAIAQTFATARGISLWRVGAIMAGDGKFFVRLQSGKTCTFRMARLVTQKFSDHWPDDLEWPSDIPRPAPRKDAA